MIFVSFQLKQVYKTEDYFNEKSKSFAGREYIGSYRHKNKRRAEQM